MIKLINMVQDTSVEDILKEFDKRFGKWWETTIGSPIIAGHYEGARVVVKEDDIKDFIKQAIDETEQRVKDEIESRFNLICKGCNQKNTCNCGSTAQDEDEVPMEW